jgi:hypothetical protein
MRENQIMNNKLLQTLVNVSMKFSYQHGYRPESYLNITETNFPRLEENCTTIYIFLSKARNMKFVSRKANELNCKNGDLTRMFRTLENFGNVDYTRENYRARSMRKWRHLVCRLYLTYMSCLKEMTSSPNDIHLPKSHTEYMEINPGEDKTEKRQTLFVIKEAVHVSDSSHIDFLNLMIGYDSDYTDDYQIWFY